MISNTPSYDEVVDANVKVFGTLASDYNETEPHFRPENRARVGAVLKRAVLAKDPAIETRPKDARIVLKAGKPAIEPDLPGQALAPDGLAEAARVALLGPVGGGPRTAVAPTTRSQAKLTAAKAAALGVKERVSTFSTNLTANPLRTERPVEICILGSLIVGNVNCIHRQLPFLGKGLKVWRKPQQPNRRQPRRLKSSIAWPNALASRRSRLQSSLMR